MAISGKEARKRAGRHLADLEQVSDELTAILEALPIPTPEEFEGMRKGARAWSDEAYLAAVLRNADLYVDKARVLIQDHTGKAPLRLKPLGQKGGAFLTPALERSLRYLVQARSGKQIPPSEAEVYFYDPSARGREVLRLFLDVAMKFCGLVLSFPGTEEWQERGDKESTTPDGGV
jgi:hypothetical protein